MGQHLYEANRKTFADKINGKRIQFDMIGKFIEKMMHCFANICAEWCGYDLNNK
jgi:hypothetical protein